VAVAYFGWQRISKDNQIKPLYEEPYVVVYGRDSCGWTQKYLKDLEDEGVDLIYESVDSKDVCDELHPRMKDAGLDIKRYNLPVIDVNGQFFIRPELEKVLAAYKIVK
jgi:hypothetical protein